MVSATRPIICLTDDSRSGESSRPRKYFCVTMFVAFCDQVAGNSTPSCLKPPTSALRISHSTVEKGSTPASVKCRSIFSPLTPDLAVSRTVLSVVLGLCGMTSPRQSGFSATTPSLGAGGRSDIGGGGGRIGGRGGGLIRGWVGVSGTPLPAYSREVRLRPR